MNYKYLGKELFLTILSGLPVTSALARQLDSIDNDVRFKKIESQIENIWIEIGKENHIGLAKNFTDGMRLLSDADLISSPEFKKFEVCMFLLEKININSKLGFSNDPLISVDEIIADLEKKFVLNDLYKDLKLASYELENHGYIFRHKSIGAKLGFSSIGPKNSFFCLTDHLFQDWSPKQDASRITTYMNENQLESWPANECDKYFRFTPRRINAALAYMDRNGYLKFGIDDQPMNTGEYVVRRIELSEEGMLH